MNAMKKALLLFFLPALAALGQTRSRLADYVLILADPPVARSALDRPGGLSHLALAQRERLRTAQASVIGELHRRKIAVAGSTQVLLNAVFVSTTPEAAAQLRSIPGVARVTPAPRFKPDLDRALSLENVPAAWSAVGGASNAGAGIKIGVIDSGIDQNHPGFQDASLKPPAGFPKGDSSYTNSKVIVARSYVALDSIAYDPNNPAATSTPDDTTPRDRIGHGTAIAMIAAGVQNSGPLATIQGVAPKAFLGNYKVFGSPSVNPFASLMGVIQALEDALADGMDIVTLSLSEGDSDTQYGPLDIDPVNCGGQCDVTSQAVETAIAAGMVVVVSVGNDGNIGTHVPTLNTIHKPGIAPSAITVGAVANSHALYQSVRTASANYAALFGDGPDIASPLTAPMIDVNGQACSGSLPALTGAIALIQRGTCSFSDKINNAQKAGAVGAIIYQSTNDPIFGSWGAQNTGIPAVMVSNSDGAALKSYIASSHQETTTLDPGFTSSDTTPSAIWPASSRGPSAGTFAIAPVYAIKPELVAVGVNVYTAAQKLDPNGDGYNASGYGAFSGTSYAVPMVAGAVALVKQKFPNLTAGQLKSAVVNTATQDVMDENGAARVDSVGAGKLSAGDAVSVAATLEPATIEFGPLTSTTVSISRTVTITNISNSAATFSFAVQQRDSDTHSSVTVQPASITLQPNTANSVTVRLSGSRSNPGNYEGFLVVTGAGPTLRVPYQYLVGSGTVYDAFPIADGGFLGGTSDQGWLLGMRVIDQAGVPVISTPLQFKVLAGGGKITLGDFQSYALGNAFAQVNLGSNPGDQLFNATVGGITVPFNGSARVYPSIDHVAPAAASGASGNAPGSYMGIYGTALSDATQVESTLSLPVALSDVSVSFDGGGLSLPGHIHFVSPGQVNVQIPWEFQGQSSVQIKVTVSTYLYSDVFTVPLTTYSPGVFAVVPSTAKRGDAVVIYANGLGPVSNQPASGEPSPSQPLAQTSANPTVTIGGAPAQVLFSGLVPGSIGLYQINAVVPAGASTGSQPLVVSENGVNSAAVNVTIQ
jgi:uncharacterized protein (TIGR03437 family)